MAKFLFKILPNKDELLATLKHSYPEADSLSLYTHMWLRLVGSRVEDAVESFLRKFDISSGRFLILMLLELKPDGAKPSEIASILGITQATVTGLIDGLTQTGYVQRKDHAKDGRACVIFLTELGKSFMTKNRPSFTQQLCGMYNPLNDDEKVQLIRLMEKLLGSANIQSATA